MKHLIDATRQSIRDKNWYSALALALTMPDICGKISFPKLKSGPRTAAWFDQYLAHNYRGGINRIQFMAGGDFYALRCAFLHQGEFDLHGQSAAQILKRFHITLPGPHHNNLSSNVSPTGEMTDSVLQLSVDQFCEEICVAVDSWTLDAASDQRTSGEVEAMGKVLDIFVNPIF